jgi:hypothetical protein
MPVVHGVAAANLHMPPLPDPYGAPDPAAPNFFAKMFGEYHVGLTALRVGTAAQAA